MSKTMDRAYKGLIKNTFRSLTGKAKKYKKQGLRILDTHFNSPYYKKSKKFLGATLICSSNLPILNGKNKDDNI